MYDIYSNDRNDEWRYTLGQSGKKPLLTIGLNPSTATMEKSDPTVTRVETVAARNGYDGFIMLNLYPVRATDYRRLPASANQAAFTKNLDAIEEVVANQSAPVIWAAWGASIEYHRYFIEARDELMDRLSQHRVKWLMFGEPTLGGHPRHPSRLSYDWRFGPYIKPRENTVPGSS